ncbi:hypothetical protein B0H17DRAFT_1148702 [Mycena rosella]|uniref:Uncharacterized protein n=1 Tax=Mycena rosella TaxID=1033263 RepID=A0AAD7C9J3_MYCRO|nr:hypothetical protein B0H17DRAFT_1148702 [Mycena rosella]
MSTASLNAVNEYRPSPVERVVQPQMRNKNVLPLTSPTFNAINIHSGKAGRTYSDELEAGAPMRVNNTATGAPVRVKAAPIVISELRDFRREREPFAHPPTAVHVKREEIFKLEPTCHNDTPVDPIRKRTLTEGGREVVEILSNSEDETGKSAEPNFDSDFEVAEALFRTAPRSSSIVGADHDSLNPVMILDSDDEFKSDLSWQESDIIWQDPVIMSEVLVGRFRTTALSTVQRLERLTRIPSIWPIPRIHTAFVLIPDSSYEQVDARTGLLYMVDQLIKKSWCCACERVDPALLQVERYELDPASRDALFAVQQNTRRREGTTAHNRTAGFYDIVIKKKCMALDAKGQLCTGNPML